MNIKDYLLAELNREVERSRHALAQVPEGKSDWKPHEKSMAFGYLANLVATMPSWIAMMINQDSLDLNPPGGSGWRASPSDNRRRISRRVGSASAMSVRSRAADSTAGLFIHPIG